MYKTLPRFFSHIILLLLLPVIGHTQATDCPYPIIFLHGWTGDQTSFSDSYDDSDFTAIYGQLNGNHVFHAMLNAQFETHIWGDDEIKGTPDDDVLVAFNNENNVLSSGCVYAINFDNAWNENNSNPILYPNDGSAIGFTESDSNESAIMKQGYALGVMIDKVLDANPDKEKVILMGHSMGGLAIREYLQRTDGGGHPWWVKPSDHRVASVLTSVTPHRGSNTLGNLAREETPQRDGLPDLLSEAVRDLRYSWACGLFGASDCPGAYLYGGAEDAGFGWWNEDVDCDGDESSTIEGINVSGSSDPWDGTYANPSLPLPDDIHYTWLTSDIIAFFGDGVVAWDRQWLFNGSTPAPSDGVSGRHTDTLLTNATHLGANDDVNVIIRGADEGDYPYYAWQVSTETTYHLLPTFRAANNPHATSTTDPDWLVFELPAGYADDLAIDVHPSSRVATELDFFGSSVNDYTDMGQTSSFNTFYPEGIDTEQRLLIPNAALNKGGTNYLRITHTNIDFNDWKVPAEVTLRGVAPLPLEWLSFDVKAVDVSTARLNWSTANEENVSHFELERSRDGREFDLFGRVTALNQDWANYEFFDREATGNEWYYRIKSHDIDGTTSYAPVRHFQRAGGGEVVLGTLFPNPASKSIQVTIIGGKNTPVEWKIINALGQTIKEGKEQLSTTINHLTIAVEHLPAGWYRFYLETDRQHQSAAFYKGG